jgi:hypothetical protein
MGRRSCPCLIHPSIQQRNRANWDEAERLYRQCLQIEEELGN